MPISEHISLELSKRLHDKGFRGKYEWVYGHDLGGLCILAKCDKHEYTNEIPAYTFIELWRVLPQWIPNPKHGKGQYDLEMGKNHNGTKTCVCYETYEGGILTKSEHHHESPTEAIGLLLEWLIDNGHHEKGE